MPRRHRRGKRHPEKGAPASKRRRLDPAQPREYLSTDPYILNHPSVKPLLKELNAITPSQERVVWNLPADVWESYLDGYDGRLLDAEFGPPLIGPQNSFAGRAAIDEVLRRNREGWPTTANQKWTCTGEGPEYKATLEFIVSGLTKILRRVRSLYLWGPFPSLSASPFRMSDIAVWPHFYKREIDKIRMLVNMSSNDRGLSLNEHISSEEKYVRYVRILEIVRLIVRAGLIWLWAIDAFEAYCRVPLEAHMISKLGIKMCGLYFFYTCLVMGYAPSSKVYTEFGDVVQWICVHRNVSLFQLLRDGTLYELMLHYLDGMSSS